MEALQHDKMLDFEEVEKAIGTGLSAAKKVHALIRQSAYVEETSKWSQISENALKFSNI